MHQRNDASSLALSRSQSAASGASPAWAYLFVAALIGFQIGLLLFGDTSLRLPIRIGAYAVSLAFAVILRQRHVTHPSLTWAAWAAGILMFGFVQTSGDSLVAGAAQVMLYCAVLAPLAWVGAVRLSSRDLRIVIMILWGFYTISALVGALQVNYPGRFGGAISANILDSTNALSAMTITLANGERVLRPTGLTDLPGGAAIAGANAIILGLGILVATQRKLLWLICGVGMAIGLFTIYLSHTRTNLVMAGIMVLTLAAVLARRKDWSGVARIGTVVGCVGFAATSWAFAVGGDETIKRFGTLVEDDPQTVLFESRGKFLQDTLGVLIFKHPAGAGLGRWGMMNQYFGVPSQMLYSEMTWTSLLYDGGLPLMLVYAVALATALWTAWKMAMHPSGGELSNWAALVFAYTMGGVAVSFSYPIFSQQPGMEIWFLNACLFSAWKLRRADVAVRTDAASLRALARRPRRTGMPAVEH